MCTFCNLFKFAACTGISFFYSSSFIIGEFMFVSVFCLIEKMRFFYMPHIILIRMVTIVADHQKIVTEASNKQQLIVSLNIPSLRIPNFFYSLDLFDFYITKGHHSKFRIKWQMEMESELMLRICIPNQGQQGTKYDHFLWFP